MDNYYGEYVGIPIINGDIFESDADAILHQVNCQGKMGSGVARQVKERYPFVYELYKQACDNDKKCRPAGMGKSMLMREILLDAIDHDVERIPVFVSVQCHHSKKQSKGYSL